MECFVCDRNGPASSEPFSEPQFCSSGVVIATLRQKHVDQSSQPIATFTLLPAVCTEFFDSQPGVSSPHNYAGTSSGSGFLGIVSDDAENFFYANLSGEAVFGVDNIQTGNMVPEPSGILALVLGALVLASRRWSRATNVSAKRVYRPRRQYSGNGN